MTRQIPDIFSIESYDFPFSGAQVADRPAGPRDSSRLLVLNRKDGTIQHRRFRDLPEYLRPGDCLVLNRTKVWPARLVGRKTTGGKAEMLLVRELSPSPRERSCSLPAAPSAFSRSARWTALSSDLKPGVTIEFSNGVRAHVVSLQEGEWECVFSTPDVRALMAEQGHAPLPPYILKKRKAPARGEGTSSTDDRDAYQTVFAKDPGSIAAPTAGFHFTSELLDRIRNMAVETVEITLHVGHGTFKPVAAADIREHRMKSEWFHIEPSALETMLRRRASGGRIIAVGTTATRSIETCLATGQMEGWTGLFIRPGHVFKGPDALITNFHLPRSTPLFLASAFAGREELFEAYRQAVDFGYRLYSYGDAMLIL